jgi:hypothetical protein
MWLVATNCTFDAVAGTTYQISLDVLHGGAGSAGFTLVSSAQAPPPNDNFADRIALSGDESTFVARNRFATREPDESIAPGVGGDSSAWWTWTAPASGFLHLDILGSDFSGIVTAFTGESLGTLTWLGSSTNSVISHVRAGEFIQIALDSTDASQGSAAIRLQFGRSPSNDDFTNRQLMVGKDVTAWSSNINASAEPTDPVHPAAAANHTVWFTWTAPTSGDATVMLADGSRGLPFSVFAGATPSKLMTVGEAPDASRYYIVRFYAAAGTAYQIAVYDDAGEDGVFGLHIIAPPPPPQVQANGMSRQADGFHLAVAGVAGQSFVLQASTNLVNWEPLLVDTMPSTLSEIIDVDAGAFGNRFYRLLPLEALFEPIQLSVDLPKWTSGEILVPVLGPAGAPFRLQCSTDLVDWVELERGFLTGTRIEIQDNDQVPQRFYRVEPLP